ncbi:MAG: AAA family ATPase, partial [Burkholderiales bacterium]|nr:AAA family ATPase [Burkholderiales bacterium]
EILHAIAFELQLDIPRDASRLAVMHAIQEHLLKRHAEGKRVVLFVEESQGMPIATLEEIRLLSNLETKSDKLLQIVLFGQPELDDNLRENSIRQLKERITHSFRLEPLTAAETREYLMFRLRAAGYRGPDLFTDGIVREIARVSGGLTRRINLVTDKALLAAFSENTHSVRQKHLDAAVRDSEFARNPRPAGASPRWGQGALLVIAGMVAGAAIFALTGRRDAPAPVAVDAEHTAPASTQSPVMAPVDNGESQKNSLKSNAYNNTVTVTPVTAAATPPVEPAAATEAPSAAGSLLDTRLAATSVWLDSAKPRTHTIQLMSSGDEQQLNNHLKFLSNIIEINSLFVYRTAAKGAPVLNVVWGSFDSQSEAREAMAKLPPSLKAYRPLLRTVQGIKAEVRSRNAP